MKKNLILTGMPTSGKSTVGVIAAKVLGMRFADTDLMIQGQAGMRLEEIIESRGLSGFLALEEQVCCGVALENTVIATGGSVVYSDKAMRHLRELGTVVYLEVPYDELLGRLHNVKQRGVVLRDGQTVESLFIEREPLYEKYADLTVNEAGCGIEDTVARLTALLDRDAQGRNK